MENLKIELRALWYIVKFMSAIVAVIAVAWIIGFIDVAVFGTASAK